MIAIEYFLGLSAILFAIGSHGRAGQEDAIVVLMCIEQMHNAANINFVPSPPTPVISKDSLRPSCPST
jgi:NADH-quinone oxidoreductase subunit K